MRILLALCRVPYAYIICSSEDAKMWHLGISFKILFHQFFFTLLCLTILWLMFECLTGVIGKTSDSVGNGFITRRHPFGGGIICAQERRNRPVEVIVFVCFVFNLWPVWRDKCCFSTAAYLNAKFLNTPLMSKHFVAQHAMCHCYRESPVMEWLTWLSYLTVPMAMNLRHMVFAKTRFLFPEFQRRNIGALGRNIIIRGSGTKKPRDMDTISGRQYPGLHTEHLGPAHG